MISSTAIIYFYEDITLNPTKTKDNITIKFKYPHYLHHGTQQTSSRNSCHFYFPFIKNKKLWPPIKHDT